jgi:hypothetical protein
MQGTATAQRLRVELRDRSVGLRARVGRFHWRAPRPWFLVAVGVAIFTWPIDPLPVQAPGYDFSWIAALHVAAHQGLHWGSQLDYTYGPLGYLTIGNLMYDRTGIPADLVIAALYIGLLAVIARTACRSLGLVVGGLLVFALARIVAAGMDPVELLAPLLLALAIGLLRRPPAEWESWQPVGICALAAFAGLDKLSEAPVALAVVVLLAIVAAAQPKLTAVQRLRAAGTILGAYLAAVIVLWLLAGQSLFDLPAYVRNGWDIIIGYDSQALIDPTQRWQYKWVVITAVLALGVAGWREWRLPRLRRAAILVLWLLFLWVSFRHAYVREAPGKGVLFFGLAALLAAAVLIGRGQRRLGILACLLPLVLSWQLGNWNVENLFTVSSAGFVANVNLLLSPAQRHADQNQAAKTLQATYGFSPELVSRLTGQTVHFDPYEATIAYAYPRFRWDPAPIFQDYNAYTSRLDDVNANFLASTRAPRYILRQNLAPDQRDPRFESPRYVLTMMCRYRQVLLSGAWQLLERGPNRCGSATVLSSERVRYDEPVAAPAPEKNAIIVATFTDFSIPFSERLHTLLFRSNPVYFSVNGSIYRFVTGHASDPHVVSFPACLGWTPAYFDATPYTGFAIGHQPQLTTPGARESSSYRVTFERLPFRCGS